MSLSDILFPKHCLSCNAPNQYICPICLAKVPPGKAHFKNTKSIWSHKGIIKKAIASLKYRHASSLVSELATLASKRINPSSYPSSLYLIPVPLHPSKLRTRGFNQAAEVGKLVAAKLNWNYIPDLIIKTKKTPPQMNLPRTKRLTNLKGVFKLNPKYKNKHPQNIIIFDDVVTTASTLNEITKILKPLKIKKIYKLTLAS